MSRFKFVAAGLFLGMAMTVGALVLGAPASASAGVCGPCGAGQCVGRFAECFSPGQKNPEWGTYCCPGTPCGHWGGTTVGSC